MNPTKTIIEKIKKGIRKADFGIVIWTHKSVGKEGIIQEVDGLIIPNKPIVILLGPGLNPPAGMAQGIQYVRLNDEEDLKTFTRLF